ncbi:hypothetical protein [Pseudomonas hygromyciniae]|uniref:hypothetical protein n=1 Tax=Pseudomonas hygromyciniae TaxID=2812000 RepID=UPI001F08079E|nr:hypothetical protein [Pseudomonas hygromyciniae]
MYDISGKPFQKLKWLYRNWFNHLEVAEKGSGLEELFESQAFNFFNLNQSPTDPGFSYLPLRSVSVSCAGDLLAVDVLTPETPRNCSMTSRTSTAPQTSSAPAWNRPLTGTENRNAIRQGATGPDEHIRGDVPQVP